MVIHEFEIPGKIKGKARPRMTRAGHAYTPQDTMDYESFIRYCYSASDGPFIEGAVGIDILCYFAIPKSTSKKRKSLMLLRKLFPKKKPDWDNIGKIVCDALNKVAYDDDASIVDGRVRKYYTGSDKGERLVVRLWRVNEEE